MGSIEDYGGARIPVNALPASAATTLITSDQFFDLYTYAIAYLPAGDHSSAGLVVGAPGYDAAADPGTFDGRLYFYEQSADWFDSTAHDATAAASVVLDADVGGEGLGVGLADAGDVDADGRVDLWISSYGIAGPSARVLLLTNTGL